MPINVTADVLAVIPDGSDNPRFIEKLNGQATVLDFLCVQEQAGLGHGPSFQYRVIEDDGEDWAERPGETDEIQASPLTAGATLITRVEFAKGYEVSYRALGDTSRHVDLIAKAISKGATRRDQTLDRRALSLFGNTVLLPVGSGADGAPGRRTNLGVAEPFSRANCDRIIDEFQEQEPEGEEIAMVTSTRAVSDFRDSLPVTALSAFDRSAGLDQLGIMFEARPAHKIYVGTYRSVHWFISDRLPVDADGRLGAIMMIGPDSEALTEVAWQAQGAGAPGATLVEIEKNARNKTYFVAMSGEWGYGIPNTKQVRVFASRETL